MKVILKNIRFIIALITIILAGVLFYKTFLYSENSPGEVLADVDISASVYSCILNFTVLPEKRIPSTGNFQNTVNLEIYDNTNTLRADIDVSTNAIGQGNVNLCGEGIFLLPGDYDVYINGTSHLRKDYGTFTGAFAFVETTEDYSNSGTDLLLAGETSNVYNNYINTLDISTQINALETSNIKNDLNRDGEVNTLDISNTVYNFYVKGDCSPTEISNNICSN